MSLCLYVLHCYPGPRAWPTLLESTIHGKVVNGTFKASDASQTPSNSPETNIWILNFKPSQSPSPSSHFFCPCSMVISSFPGTFLGFLSLSHLRLGLWALALLPLYLSRALTATSSHRARRLGAGPGAALEPLALGAAAGLLAGEVGKAGLRWREDREVGTG